MKTWLTCGKGPGLEPMEVDPMKSQGGVGLVLAAAGSGSRFGGDLPKQFLEYRGKRLYLHALDPFLTLVREAVVVVPEGWVERVQGELDPVTGVLFKVVVGGDSRQASVERGLREVSGEVNLVLVHDAARAFVSQGLIRRVMDGARRFGACIPGLAPSDTVKLVRGSRVFQTLPREDIRLVQTPQAFRVDLLARALASAQGDGFTGTDESSLVERLGIDVCVVDGEPTNRKITWEDDLEEDRQGRSGQKKA